MARPLFSTTTAGITVAVTLALSGAGAALLSGCAPSHRPPNISSVTPSQSYTDHAVVLRVSAGDLRPSLKLDLASQRLTTDLGSVRIALIPEDPGPRSPTAIALETIDWDGVWDEGVQPDGQVGGQVDAFWARTPPEVVAGQYAVHVTDPRGQSSSLARAFVALGPDVTPPTIALVPPLPPDSLFFGGSSLAVRIMADDDLGSIADINWSTSDGGAGDCLSAPLPPGGPPALGATTTASQIQRTLRQAPLSRAVCAADISLPAVPDDGPMIIPFSFHAEAWDGSDHRTSLDIPLRIARPARIVTFASAVGGLAGKQPFLVRGRDFLPGSQALLDGVPLLPRVDGGTPGGDLRDDQPGQSGDSGSNQSIVGLTPPRARPGVVLVQVRSPAGTVSSLYGFSYVGPPNIRDVQPATGPRGGGNRIVIKGNDLRYDAQVYIGPTRERRLPLFNLQTSVTDNKIVGCVPPGEGTVSVWVEDQVTGEGVYPDGYTYEDSDAGTDTSAGIDPACR